MVNVAESECLYVCVCVCAAYSRICGATVSLAAAALVKNRTKCARVQIDGVLVFANAYELKKTSSI